jgi:hypothetical protein
MKRTQGSKRLSSSLFLKALTLLFLASPIASAEVNGGSGGAGGLLDQLKEYDKPGACVLPTSDTSCKEKIDSNPCDFLVKLSKNALQYDGQPSKRKCLRGLRESVQATCKGASLTKGQPSRSEYGGVWCQNAKDAGGCLQKLGLANDQQQLQSLQANKSAKPPFGAILVYEDPNNKKHPGHIEVFTGEKYCSDYCSPRRRDGATNNRKLIGVYLPKDPVSGSSKTCNDPNASRAWLDLEWLKRPVIGSRLTIAIGTISLALLSEESRAAAPSCQGCKELKAEEAEFAKTKGQAYDLHKDAVEKVVLAIQALKAQADGTLSKQQLELVTKFLSLETDTVLRQYMIEENETLFHDNRDGFVKALKAHPEAIQKLVLDDIDNVIREFEVGQDPPKPKADSKKTK